MHQDQTFYPLKINWSVETFLKKAYTELLLESVEYVRSEHVLQIKYLEELFGLNREDSSKLKKALNVYGVRISKQRIPINVSTNTNTNQSKKLSSRKPIRNYYLNLLNMFDQNMCYKLNI